MNSRSLIFTLVFLLLPGLAMARDDKHMLSIQEALDMPAAKEKLNQGIKFYFGKKGPAAKSTLGTHVANRKTNAFGKSDEEACKWVFLSALIALQDRAVKDGGDAVVDIHSYYKKDEMRSTDQFECHAGAIMAGVALRGTVVKLK